MKKRVETLFAKLMGGTRNERFLRDVQSTVEEINAMTESYQQLTDEELQAKTQEFKYRLRMGETLDELLPEAFAAVKDTCRRLIGTSWTVRGQDNEWNMIPYDVQLIGAVALHQGKIAEMATGEGKTLVATMPLYLNALEGKGAHLITVNDYLAQRDCEWMGKIYEFLGLKTAYIINDQSPEERRAAYNADITYGTNNEFGFDYLRDNMAVDVWSVVQRPLHYAIIDEVDSVLIDEARTPLIISGSVGAPRNVYNDLKPVVENLYKRQKELVDQLIREGKSLLDTDEELAVLMLLRAQRGDPKNDALLKLLTSEFQIKKMIERLQGQHEVNKTMGEVDSELYYTIDEKSNVVDITEKGRIFLSGGRDQDIVYKIQLLDLLDSRLAELVEKKNTARYFNQDSITGICNGFAPAGKLFLCGTRPDIGDDERLALDEVDKRFRSFPDRVDQLTQDQKMDKQSAWRHFFTFSKKMDKTVVGLTDEGMAVFEKGDQTETLSGLVSQIKRVFDIFDELSREGTEPDSRTAQDRYRFYLSSFFEQSDQNGSLVGLTEEGRVALLALQRGGDIHVLPFVAKMTDILNGTGTDSQTAAERQHDYFEFSENGSFIRHVSEKGRIALLGGNPDLYVLPDRSIVEERDRQIQTLLDETLNQSTFDYTERVLAIERISKDVQNWGHYTQAMPEELQKPLLSEYLTTERVYHEDRVGLAPPFRNLLTGYAHEIRSMVDRLDEVLGQNEEQQNCFRVEGGKRIRGLSRDTLDDLLGMSYETVEKNIRSFEASHQKQREQNSTAYLIELDKALKTEWPDVDSDSLSRRFFNLRRIDQVIATLFKNLYETDLSVFDKKRLLRRYFAFQGDVDGWIDPGRISGLSNAGYRNLLGDTTAREKAAERLISLVEQGESDFESIFVLDASGIPVDVQKSMRRTMVDGLPFFEYETELHHFREEINKLRSKKVHSKSELNGLLPREIAHLKGQRILLEDREFSELLQKAHAPNYILSNEEIEHWFRVHFVRKPRKILENRRDRHWRDYNEIEERIQNISQLLKAYTLFHKDVDYVVKSLDDQQMRGRRQSARGGKAVVIVDQFTGRLMPGRRFSEGLHEALEAKEGVQVQAESQTLATITLQNFFRIYNKLAGMTGTAETEAQEFFSTYELEVVVIPTNRPVVRDDKNDVIYRTKQEKYDAIVDKALEMHENGRPVLIGTVSVDVSQRISELFTRRGIPIANWLKKGDVSKELESGRFHTVLNAKFHGQEAEIVRKAGLAGAITIATNMAGRGTDIKLMPQVVEAGGLHIIGSEKHESRRIDRQLRGRSGRQGDPGSSQFYLSLEDDLMRLFGSDRITNIMSRMGGYEEGERIEHPLITRSIERAQKKVEERNFEIRKNLLEYDNVLNEQRKIIYKRRQNLLGFSEPDDFVESKTKRFFNEDDDRSEWSVDALLENLRLFFDRTPDFGQEDFDRKKHPELKDMVLEWVKKQQEEDSHLMEVQIRHRLLGYTSIDDLIAELVRLKIRLHNAGTDDTSRWNRDGLIYELERIFGQAPELLQSSAELGTAIEVETQLISWANDRYHRTTRERMPDFDRLLLTSLSLSEFTQIAIVALMNWHLSAAMTPLSWNTDRFMQALELIFDQKPDISAADLREMRRERLEDNLFGWLQELEQSIKDDHTLRHRVFGHIPVFYYINALVHYSFRTFSSLEDPELDSLTSAQKSFLEGALAPVFDEFPDVNGAQDLGQVVLKRARDAYRTILLEHREAETHVMLFGAAVEEMIQATMMANLRDIVASDPANAPRKLAFRCEQMFLARPETGLDNNISEHDLELYREKLLAWTLAHHEEQSYRDQRIQQERLSGEIVRDSVYSMIDETVYQMIAQILGSEDLLDANMLMRLQTESRLVFRHSPQLDLDDQQASSPSVLLKMLRDWAQGIYRKRVEEIGPDLSTRYERFYVLEKIDENWRQHLNGVDELREGIGLRGYGQKDPLLEYKSEAYKLFIQTVERLNRDVVSTLFRVFDVGAVVEEDEMQHERPSQYKTTHHQVQTLGQDGAPSEPRKAKAKAKGPAAPSAPKTVVKQKRVGRNDPCPCGSGKKYKQCCGRMT